MQKGQQGGRQAFLVPEHRSRHTLGGGGQWQSWPPKPPCPLNTVQDTRPSLLCSLSSKASLESQLELTEACFVPRREQALVLPAVKLSSGTK